MCFSGRARNCPIIAEKLGAGQVRIEMRLLGDIAGRILCAIRSCSIGEPLYRMLPSLASMNPAIILMVVDLPEPLGPK